MNQPNLKLRKTVPLTTDQVEPQLCSAALRLKILRRVPFFVRLSEKELERVNELFREHGFAAGETIYWSGTLATQLYVVASGKVKLSRHTALGQDVLLDILAPGDFFGSLSPLGDSLYPDSAQAQTNCCVLGIGAEDFQSILQENPSVAPLVLNIVAERLREAHDTIRQLSANSVESRIAFALCKLGEKLGEESRNGLLIQMPLSRQDLAEMTGTTTETASRILSHFREMGLIHSGRRWVAIADRERLSAIAAETPR